jgi:hypothetical protein
MLLEEAKDLYTSLAVCHIERGAGRFPLTDLPSRQGFTGSAGGEQVVPNHSDEENVWTCHV